MSPGWYAVDKVQIKVENLVFNWNAPSLQKSELLSDLKNPSLVTNADQRNLFLWSPHQALDVRLSVHKKIHLEQPRSLDIKICTGWNHVIQGNLSLRAGSAGLRLHVADAVLTAGPISLSKQSLNGNIGFAEVSSNAAFIVSIPYSLEDDLKDINVKIEVTYETTKGRFIFSCSPTIPVILPLGVNVQDLFQHDILFSKFTINTVNSIPLRVSRCNLEDSETLNVLSPGLPDDGLIVFPRQPLSLVSMISRKSQRKLSALQENISQIRLLLNVTYRCLDEEIQQVFEQFVLSTLTAVGLEKFNRLFSPTSISKWRSHFSSHDFEIMGMVGEIAVRKILRSHLETISTGVQPDRYQELLQWIENLREV